MQLVQNCTNSYTGLVLQIGCVKTHILLQASVPGFPCLIFCLHGLNFSQRTLYISVLLQQETLATISLNDVLSNQVDLVDNSMRHHSHIPRHT